MYQQCNESEMNMYLRHSCIREENKMQECNHNDTTVYKCNVQYKLGVRFFQNALFVRIFNFLQHSALDFRILGTILRSRLWPYMKEVITCVLHSGRYRCQAVDL